MSERFRVTYDVITPESATRGDVAEYGFVRPDGLRVAPLTGEPTPGVGMSLRRALELFNHGPGCVEEVGAWFVEADGRLDLRTLGNERRALHPPHHITPASYGRLARLVGA